MATESIGSTDSLDFQGRANSSLEGWRLALLAVAERLAVVAELLVDRRKRAVRPPRLVLHSRSEVAAAWLAERFRERPEWPSTELFSLAHAAGIGRNALFEAKTLLRLPRPKREHRNGKSHFVWWTQEQAA